MATFYIVIPKTVTSNYKPEDRIAQKQIFSGQRKISLIQQLDPALLEMANESDLAIIEVIIPDSVNLNILGKDAQGNYEITSKIIQGKNVEFKLKDSNELAKELPKASNAAQPPATKVVTLEPVQTSSSLSHTKDKARTEEPIVQPASSSTASSAAQPTVSTTTTFFAKAADPEPGSSSPTSNAAATSSYQSQSVIQPWHLPALKNYYDTRTEKQDDKIDFKVFMDQKEIKDEGFRRMKNYHHDFTTNHDRSIVLLLQYAMLIKNGYNNFFLFTCNLQKAAMKAYAHTTVNARVKDDLASAEKDSKLLADNFYREHFQTTYFATYSSKYTEESFKQELGRLAKQIGDREKSPTPENFPLPLEDAENLMTGKSRRLTLKR